MRVRMRGLGLARRAWGVFRGVVPVPWHGNPWRRGVADGWPSRAVPTMLTGEEVRLLRWAGRAWYAGRGTVVDCGCFLGGSTAALCAGLRRNRAAEVRPGVVHVYDRFTYDPYFDEWVRAAGGAGYAPGESFLPLWRRLNRADLPLVTLHPGDVLGAAYDAGPVEVLFLDVCKSWEINAKVVRTFFPHLVPGRGLVVQQDYAHFFAYWLVLTMDWFRDYFTCVGRVGDGASAVFRLDRPIPPGVLGVDPRDLPLARKKEAFDRELARSRGWQRTEMMVAYYRMLAEAGDPDGAARVARAIDPAARKHPVNKVALTFVPPDLLAA